MLVFSSPSSELPKFQHPVLLCLGREKGLGKRWDPRKRGESPKLFVSSRSDQKWLKSQAVLQSVSISIEMRAGMEVESGRKAPHPDTD